MGDGHRTSSITRPRQQPSERPRGRAGAGGGGDRTRLDDFTRPIARDKQLVKGRGKRTLVALGATVILVALMSALFVLPVQSWFRQRDDISRKQQELAALTEANAHLKADVTRLNTPDGVREAAREEIGYVDEGENRVTMMPPPNAPLTLPAGWPYDAVTQIIQVRTSEAAAAAAAAATTSPPVAETTPAAAETTPPGDAETPPVDTTVPPVESTLASVAPSIAVAP